MFQGSVLTYGSRGDPRGMALAAPEHDEHVFGRVAHDEVRAAHVARDEMQATTCPSAGQEDLVGPARPCRDDYIDDARLVIIVRGDRLVWRRVA